MTSPSELAMQAALPLPMRLGQTHPPSEASLSDFFVNIHYRAHGVAGTPKYHAEKRCMGYPYRIIARPGIGEKYYASRLLHAALDYLVELLNRGVIIRRIYTVATTEDGERLAQSLGFTPLPGKWKGEYEDFRRPYVLYQETQESKSRLVSEYLKQKKNLERRQKRYKKETSAWSA